MSTLRPASLVLLTALAMLAFAGNSLLCRLALAGQHIDPLTFTAVRLFSGALMLTLIVHQRGGSAITSGSWPSAMALFVYAAAFSFAYVRLSAATGALLLFGAVQTTMISYGLYRGERLSPLQWTGLFLAMAGLLILLLPGFAAPSLLHGTLMLLAGIAWGVYSLRGKAVGDPISATAGNFLRTLPIVFLMAAINWDRTAFDGAGIAYALASGALASGLGYAIWYTALRGLTATAAATVQLVVPILAAVAGVVFLAEAFTAVLLYASATILGGMLMVVLARKRDNPQGTA